MSSSDGAIINRAGRVLADRGNRSLTPLGEASLHLPSDEAETMKIAVLAGGNFGTAIATVAARKVRVSLDRLGEA